MERRSLTYGRAPNAIDISKGSLPCPSKHRRRGHPIYGYSKKPHHLVAFLRNAEDMEELYLILNPRDPHGGLQKT